MNCNVCHADVDAASALVWRKDGFDVIRCPSCGLAFRADPPDEAQLADIYDGEYFRDQPDGGDRHGYGDYLRDATLHRANARRRLRLLTGFAASRGRLLDVGCAAGFFVDEARQAGWNASGCDVSAAMIEFATSRLQLPVVKSAFVHVEAAEQFDAITMWDYIEHSIDPHLDLEHAHRQLGADGLLALSTGDIGSAIARLTGRRWHLLTPEHHNFFFDRRTLHKLLEDSGFRVLYSRHRAALYSVSHALYKLGGLGQHELLRRTASRLGRSSVGQFGVPINLYDILTVVAQRR